MGLTVDRAEGAQMIGDESTSLTRWATTAVLTAILALATFAVVDSRSTLKDAQSDVKVLQTQVAARDTRIAVLESQFAEILRRLDSIDRAVWGGARHRTFEDVRAGSSDGG